MDKIMPSKPFNANEELEKLRKQNKRAYRIETTVNIAMLILATTATIAIWITLNQRMGNQAWQEGYDRGYEQSQWDYIDREINSRDYGTTYMEPTTDAEIWKTYHDCDIYGLPEYAEQYCKEKAQEA